MLNFFKKKDKKEKKCELCSVSDEVIQQLKGEQKEFANLKCPFCGFIQKVEIPQDKCLLLHKCGRCGKVITTPDGECCVICAYSDKKCPAGSKKY